MKTDYKVMRHIADDIITMVEKKGQGYGESWRKRGGVGAFFSMSRKWDRIENFVEKNGWDILKCLADNPGDVRDDLDDLIGYLLLVREATAAGQALTGAPQEHPWSPNVEFVSTQEYIERTRPLR